MVRFTKAVSELELYEMKKQLIPGLVVVVGILSIVSHLAASNCGEPIYSAPARCILAKSTSPQQASGDCSIGADGVCSGSVCSQEAWGTAVPGRCEVQHYIEMDIPQCETGASTAVTIKKWVAVCYSQDVCWCLWDETGETTDVEVCTCTDPDTN